MSSSSRTKLPAKPNAAQHSEGRRKPAKRALVINSDDEEGVPTDPAPASKKPRLEDEDEEYMEQQEQLSRLSKGKSAQSGKRKRKPVRGDADDDDNFMAEEGEDYADAISDYAEEDEDFEDAPKKASKPGKGAKLKGGRGGPKAKTRPEPKEIIVRDERKGVAVQKDKPAKPALKMDEITAVGGPASAVSTPSVSTSAADKDGSSPTAKKRKLPTIKKNKVPAPTQPATAKPAAAKLAIDGNPLPTTSSVVRTPAANVGHADFDLRNKNVYNALFSSTGSSRSGHLREEERRKELNKMRDDARAKRAAEANNSFDLQEQMEKILRYEPKLRPFVLYPNILAAKCKEEYEHERGRARGRDERKEAQI